MEPTELRNLRVRAGLSQEAMAKKLGVSRVQISRIERGISSTPVETIVAWHRACGYRLEAVGLANEAESEALARALSKLDGEDLREVLRVATVWPTFTLTERAVIRAFVESHEA